MSWGVEETGNIMEIGISGISDGVDMWSVTHPVVNSDTKA